MNPISSAASGLIAASNSFDQASVNLSNAASGQGDIASAITGQISAKIAVEAEAKVLQSTQQTFKDTLNILV